MPECNVWMSYELVCIQIFNMFFFLPAGLPTIHEIHDFCNYGKLNVETGIPEEAFDLPCPDVELKASILQEYIMIDQRYMTKLHALEEEHSTITRYGYIMSKRKLKC